MSSQTALLESEIHNGETGHQAHLLLEDAVSSYQATSSPRLTNRQVVQLRKNAISSAQECLSLDKTNIDAHNVIARVYLDEAKIKLAFRWAKSALALDRQYATTWFTLGQIYLAQDQLEPAEQAFTKCIELDSSIFRAHTSYALTKLRQGELVVAFQYYRRLARANANDPHVRSKLFECLKQLKADYDNTSLADDLVEYFHWDDVNYNDLTNITTSLLSHRYQINDSNAVVDIAKMNQDPLLLVAMEKIIFHDKSLEHFLTDIRRFLLSSELSTPDSQSVDLLAAFAWQAFNNEHAFIEADEETTVVRQLIEKVKIVPIEQLSIESQSLLLISMYRPLSDAFTDEQLQLLAGLPDALWPRGYRKLFAALLSPYKSRQSAAIATLGSIDNPVSKAVKCQYERNPYPRWLALEYHTPTNYAEALENTLSGFKAPQILHRSPLNILVAGCGTGKHALHVARYFRDVQVTAIDISTASLQYAQAMADRYKLSNIDFLQADILELHQLNQKFDIIECSGVLHHMESPLQGAQKLVGLLKPKGIMKIGLYSERARHSIVQCRNLIREQNIESTPDGIRQLRREVLSNEHDDWKNIQVSPDFYSASGCRDLLLHVQEHRFTPLQLKELIEHLDVNFLGFSNLNNSIIERYQARFPKDKYLLNLRHWDTYETDHPATFAAMYQFYVQKA